MEDHDARNNATFWGPIYPLAHQWQNMDLKGGGGFVPRNVNLSLLFYVGEDISAQSTDELLHPHIPYEGGSGTPSRPDMTIPGQIINAPLILGMCSVLGLMMMIVSPVIVYKRYQSQGDAPTQASSFLFFECLGFGLLMAGLWLS